MTTATRDVLFVGPYEVRRRLGKGGAAVVFRGRDRANNRDVALKILKRRWAEDNRCRVRFAREAFILRSLSHSAVPEFIELRRYQGSLVLVEEYVRGATLDALIKEESAIYAERCVPWFITILDALEHIHGQGIVHRDLKPQNLLISGDSPKILDFGLAQMTGSPRLTKPGRTVGTPHYLSQEQARGQRVDRRADIYALGVTMYRTLTGCLPFDGETRRKLLHAILKEEPVPLTEQWPSVDPDLQAIVLKALSKEPEERYQSAAEMRVALESWLSVAWLGGLEGLDRASRPVSRSRESRRTTSSIFNLILKRMNLSD